MRSNETAHTLALGNSEIARISAEIRNSWPLTHYEVFALYSCRGRYRARVFIL
jgi:hypothetical protein